MQANFTPLQRPPPPRLSHKLNMRRWDAIARTTTPWDGLRRDSELWDPEGDCLVYLYSRGHSQRGPSIRVSLHALLQSRCEPLIALGSSPSSPDEYLAIENSTPFDNSAPASPNEGPTELFLGAPGFLSGDEAFKWHATTRNFFAWIMGKPLVGDTLGWALTSLLSRMQLYRDRSVDNFQDLMNYSFLVRYSTLGTNPEHALAMLRLAEETSHPDLWKKAFAHCVGMHHLVASSGEYSSISEQTKNAMLRASLTLDLQIAQASRSINMFLEEDMSPESIGLNKNIRHTLDDFRSFLHSFCVSRFGYWPPDETTPYHDLPYQTLHDDFEQLYNLLADRQVTDANVSHALAVGGICVTQQIDALNIRKNGNKLPYSLPLLPLLASTKPFKAGMRSFRESRNGKVERAQEALLSATNPYVAATRSAPLVERYVQFEAKLAAEFDDLNSLVEIRKMCWLIVYGMLQLLSVFSHVPVELQDESHVPYPLNLPLDDPPFEQLAKHEGDFEDHLMDPVISTSDDSAFAPKRSDEEINQLINNASTISRRLSTALHMPFARQPKPRVLQTTLADRSPSLYSRSSVYSERSAAPSPLNLGSPAGSSSSEFEDSVPGLEWSRQSRTSSDTPDTEEPVSPKHVSYVTPPDQGLGEQKAADGPLVFEVVQDASLEKEFTFGELDILPGLAI